MRSLALLLLLASFARADDWPCWRGPKMAGHSAEKTLPLKWTAKDNVAWTTPLPGVGHSSPIVVKDRVFVTCCATKQESRLLLCLDRADGKVLWQREVVKSPLEPKHGLNSYASATPASDGRHVWVAFVRLRPKSEADDLPRKPREAEYLTNHKTLGGMVSEMVVACYGFDGALQWTKSPGQFYSRHGFCSTPVLYKDSVVLNGDQDAEAFVVALDKATGSEKWRVDRPQRTRSYCVPLIVDAAGKTQLVMSGAKAITSYDPNDGKQIWSVDGPTDQFVASPVFTGETFFVTAGFPTYHNIAIRPDGVGNVTKTHVVWHENKTIPRKASYVPSPIAFDRWIFVVSDDGYLNCLEAKSGNRLWVERLGNHHSGSPVLAGGHVYFPADDGTTYVVKASPTFELVSENPLGDACYSSPAVSNGQIFVRCNRALYCIGK